MTGSEITRTAAEARRLSATSSLSRDLSRMEAAATEVLNVCDSPSEYSHSRPLGLGSNTLDRRNVRKYARSEISRA
jgi:hypothetical protein